MKAEKTEVSEWDPEPAAGDDFFMQDRIASLARTRGWSNFIFRTTEKYGKIDRIKAAEIGCGTGTFSLTLAALGAEVVLIDINQKALDNAKRIFAEYGFSPECILADCLNDPPQDLIRRFDIVLSGGLGEHFTGEDRKKCFRFHIGLLADGGLLYFSVPNRLSAWYWIIRILRKMQGSWDISVEVPFSAFELQKYARAAELDGIEVIGNETVMREVKIYSRGMLSIIRQALPASIGNALLRKKENYMKKKYVSRKKKDVYQISQYLQKIIDRKLNKKIRTDYLADMFSAGIILFAEKRKGSI